MGLSALHMIARGRVQGVGFRFFVREQATALGIRGWVKNLPDGSVEIHAESDRETLLHFIDMVGRGPLFGTVSELARDWIEPDNSHTIFDIVF